MFNFKSIFNLKSEKEKQEYVQEIWKEVAEKWLQWMQDSLDQEEKDYFNPENYPLYQRNYHDFKKELWKLSTEAEYDEIYKRIESCFSKTLELYKKSDLEEKEKQLEYYQENMAFHFFDDLNKLLRLIGMYYKKNKSDTKTEEIFSKIIGQWTQNNELLFTIRQNDIKTLIALYKKSWDTRLQKMEEFYTEYQKLSEEKKVQELKERREWSIKIEEERFEQHKQYCKELKIGWYKIISTQWDSEICDICLKASQMWWIHYDEVYPNWLLHTPFHEDCRCTTTYHLWDNPSST